MKSNISAKEPVGFAVIGGGPKFPVIEKDPAWCLMTLTSSLRALADLTGTPVIERDTQHLNELHRDDLAGLFGLLADYAEATKRAIPEHATSMAIADLHKNQ